MLVVFDVVVDNSMSFARWVLSVDVDIVSSFLGLIEDDVVVGCVEWAFVVGLYLVLWAV